MIAAILKSLFGKERNVLRETVEIFRENAEARAVRMHLDRSAAIEQFAAEFRASGRGRFDRIVDAVNRLPRPMMAFATLGLLGAAMTSPEWFARRMQGLSLVPEPLWWLLGVIVSFYFGARHQAKSQEFQHDLAKTVAHFSNDADDNVQMQGRGTRRSAPDATSAAQSTVFAGDAYRDNPALAVWVERKKSREAAEGQGQ